MFRTVSSYFSAPEFSTPSHPDLGRTLHFILLTIFIGLLEPVGYSSWSLVAHGHPLDIVTIVLHAEWFFVIVCYVLNKRGWSPQVAVALPFSLVPLLFIIIDSSPMHVYDVGMFAYGPSFILASALLTRRQYILFSVVQLIAIVYHFRIELGAPSLPGYSEREIMKDFFDAVSLNFITAVASHILSTSVLRHYRLAKTNESALRESEQRLDSIIRTTPSGILLFGTDGSVTYANRIARELFRLAEGPGPVDLLPPWGVTIADDTGKVLDMEGLPFLRVIRSGTAEYRRVFTITATGMTPAALLMNVAPMLDANGAIIGAIASFNNITGQRIVEEELSMQREQISAIAANLHTVIYRVHYRRGRMVVPLYISNGAHSVLGYDAEELMNNIRLFMGAIHRDDAARYIRALRVLADHPEPFSHEMRFRHRDGRERWFRNTGHPYRISSEEVVIDGFIVDITAQKEAEQELHMLGEAVTRSTDVIFMVDRNDRFRFVNPRFTELYGYTAEEVVGIHTPLLLEHRPNGDITKAVLWDRLAQSATVDTTFTNRTKEGTIVEVETSMTPILGAAGSLLGYLSVQRDITERKRLADALQQSKKMESLSILAGGVAHEFNNLLTTILGRASLVKKKVDPAGPIHASVAKIEQAAHRASGLTKQLLAYSGRSRFEIRAVNLNDVIRENIGFITSSAESSATVTTDLDPQLPPVMADFRQMQQLVANLVTNALESLQVPGRTVSVRTITTVITENDKRNWQGFSGNGPAAGPYVVMEVSDEGSGMSPDVLQKIFDPFYTTKFTGRGLGLSAVLGILHGHQGGIMVESEQGKGSVFRVALPAKPVPPPEEARPPRRTVLVVDDEIFNQELLRDVLESEEIPTFTAATAGQALALMQQHAGDCAMVLLDVHLPDAECADTLHRFRAMAPDVPVVLCSGLPLEAIAGGEQLEPDAFLQKPFHPDALLALYRSFLR